MADLSAQAAPEISEDLGLVEAEVSGELHDTLPLQELVDGPRPLEEGAQEAPPAAPVVRTPLEVQFFRLIRWWDCCDFRSEPLPIGPRQPEDQWRLIQHC